MSKNTIDLNGRTILVTGSMGLIGANPILRLLKDCKNATIIGIDNFNDYYGVDLKEYRVNLIAKAAEESSNECRQYKYDMADKKNVEEVFRKFRPSVVVNLAAQAGVRYSIESPDTYIQSNIIGFITSLKPVDTLAKKICWVYNTLSVLHPRQYMEVVRIFLLRLRIM